VLLRYDPDKGKTMKKQGKIKVLFLCTHNSARSQMAEGLLKTLFGHFYEGYSAGVEPLYVHPYAIEVMKEIGIDISYYHAKGIEQFLEMNFDYIVTVCDNAKEVCPYFPNGEHILHKGFNDPASVSGNEDKTHDAFRKVRDEIKEWIIETFRPVG
jgi:arsenate reductase